MHTGRFCPISGMYRTSCPCAVKREVRRGDEFPKCPKCERSVDWVHTVIDDRPPKGRVEPPPRSR